MRIQEAMDGEEMEQREKERRPMAAVGTVVFLRAKRRERSVAASGGGVVVARDGGTNWRLQRPPVPRLQELLHLCPGWASVEIHALLACMCVYTQHTHSSTTAQPHDLQLASAQVLSPLENSGWLPAQPPFLLFPPPIPTAPAPPSPQHLSDDTTIVYNIKGSPSRL